MTVRDERELVPVSPLKRFVLRGRHWLLVILLVGFLLRVFVAMRSPNLNWADEVFQTQEPGHRLAYSYGVITWEFRRGVRSWVFPAFLAGIMRATDWMGRGSSGYLLGIAIILSAISLTTIWFGFAWAKCAAGADASVIAAVACATWFELIYFAPKALNEVLAAHFVLPGLYLGVYGEKPGERIRLFLAGLLCGFAMALRIQLAPALVFAAAYFCYPNWRRKTPFVLAGLVLPVLIFGLVDAMTWSHPFQSFFLYFYVNVIEGRSLLAGVQPWYWYLTKLATHFGPLAIFALIGVRKSTFLGWIVLIILISHSMLKHKEVRFLYPLVAIVITLAVLGMVEVGRVVSVYCKLPSSSEMVVITWVTFCLVTSAYLGSQFRNWSRSAGGLIALDGLSRDSTVCGIGLYDVDWSNTGGYTHLHKNIPMFLLSDRSKLEADSTGYNVLLTSRLLDNDITGFELAEHAHEIYLYKRPGSCTAHGGGINETLREIGQ